MARFQTVHRRVTKQQQVAIFVIGFWSAGVAVTLGFINRGLRREVLHQARGQNGQVMGGGRMAVGR